MMDAKAIRGWLLCQPRASKIKIVSEDEQSHFIDIVPGTSWAQVAQSVEALKPDLVECIDAAGNLIRAVRPSDEDDEDEEEGYTVSADGESQRLIVFAKLLASAYKHSTSTAFDKLGELFESVTRRSESLEKTVEAMNRVLVRTAIENAAAGNNEEAGGGSFESMMAQAFAAGIAKKQAADAVTAAAVNGGPVKS